LVKKGIAKVVFDLGGSKVNAIEGGRSKERNEEKGLEHCLLRNKTVERTSTATQRSLEIGMAKELEKKAKEAFFDDDFSLAVDFYSEAVQLDPNDAHLFADRAQAYIKLNAFTGSLPHFPSFNSLNQFHSLSHSLNLVCFHRQKQFPMPTKPSS